MNKSMMAALALTLFASPVLAEEAATSTTGSHPAHPSATSGADMFFDKVDTDKDGKISKAEFSAKGDEMFAESDANKDGFITREEGRAAHEARKAKWKAHKDDWEAGKAPVAPTAD